MFRAFFDTSTLSGRQPPALLPRCGSCGLSKTCRSPKLPVVGEGLKRILIVGTAPTDSEDRHGSFLKGDGSRKLIHEFEEVGIQVQKDCWYTSALICAGSEASVTGQRIEDCRPNILSTIQRLRPRVVVLLGKSPVSGCRVEDVATWRGAAYESVLGHYWDGGVGDERRWEGAVIPLHKPAMWICPIWSPERLLYSTGRNNEVMTSRWRRHLKTIAELPENGPHPNGPPQYESRVDIVLDPAKVVSAIRKITQAGGLTAFDYETTCLKPERPGAYIVSCSICYMGRRTIAFMMDNEDVRDALRLYLRSSVPKIASNLKFEERWSIRHMSTRVRGWVWDTMQNAHILNQCPEVSGLKFQAFVRLGQLAYHKHVEPYLRSTETGLNRVRDLRPRDLLLYNGLDSHLEWHVACSQAQEMNIELPGRN